MTFSKIENRLVAPAKYGKSVLTAPPREAPYDGGHLTSFYARHGVEIENTRAALRASRVGSVFDLEIGTSLLIPSNL